MVHRTNRARLRISRHLFCSGFESTFEHFDKHPEPDMKRQKLPLSNAGFGLCKQMSAETRTMFHTPKSKLQDPK
jgi:hypothetical protein